MGFFSRRDTSQAQGARSRAEQIILQSGVETDLVIADCRMTTDMAVREAAADSAASWIYTRRWLMAQREREFPGITDEVNQIRARQGLPPI